MISWVKSLFRLLTFFLIIMNSVSSKLSIFIWIFINSVSHHFWSFLLSDWPLTRLRDCKIGFEVRLNLIHVLWVLFRLKLVVSVWSKMRSLAVLNTHTLTACLFWFLRLSVGLLTVFLATVICSWVKLVTLAYSDTPCGEFLLEVCANMT